MESSSSAPVPSPSRRLPGALPVAAFAALVLAVYADPLFTGRAFVGRDIVPYNLPLEKVVHDAWSNGRLPVWWETVSGGRPLLPNPNAGVFYPPRTALALVPFETAMRLFPVFHWLLGGIGMLRLARSTGASRSAAWVAASSFAFSGVVVSEVFYSNFQPGAALLPWSLWALARTTRGFGGRVLGIALVYGAMILAGDAFSVAIALLAAALWIALETSAPDRGERAAGLAVGFGAAVLIALPQVLATALLAPETRRVVGGVTLAEAVGFTPPAWRLLELVVPFPFGPTASMDLSRDWGTHVFRHFFATFFVGPIALAGLLRGPRNAARGWRFARALALAAVMLALAGHLLPEAWGRLPSPVPLRYPEKFMLGATFALALSAGIAVDRLRSFRTGGRSLLLAAGGLTVLAAAAALVPEAAGRLIVGAVTGDAGLAPSAARELATALAVAGLLWAATAVAADAVARPGRGRLLAAMALLTAVPLLANRGIARTAHAGTVYPPTPFAREIARRDPEGQFRTLDVSLYRPVSPLLAVSEAGDLGGSELYRQSWYYYTPTLWDRGTVLNSDLDAGDLSRIESLRKLSGAAVLQPDANPFFSALSLRYAIRFRGQEPAAGFRRFGGDAMRDWDENPQALPDMRLVSRWREETGPVGALRAMPGLLADEIVVETGRRAQGTARPGRLSIVERSPGRMVLETAADDPTWLFVLRGDWSYRTVTIDGRSAETRPAQLAFTAVPVPGGRHRVEWRENAPGLDASRWGPLAGALVLLAAARWRRSP